MTAYQRTKANLARYEKNPAERAKHFRALAEKNAGKPAAAMFEAQAREWEAKAGITSAKAPATPATVVQLAQAPAAASSREVASLKAELESLKAQVAPTAPTMTDNQLFAAAVHAFGHDEVRRIIARDNGTPLAVRIERALFYANIDLPHSFSAEAMKHGPAKPPFGFARIQRAEQQRRVDAWLQRKAK